MSDESPVARIPEVNKKPGVCYAVTDGGIELPVIDVTHPGFAVEVRRDQISALSAASLRSARRAAKVPTLLRRFVARRAARRSLLVRGLVEGVGSHLSGLTTYLQKLGPDNLGTGWACSLDRRMAGTIFATAVRLRLADMARLLCDGLARALREPRSRAVHLLSIGGGAATDSLNALILIRKEHPERLAGCPVTIHVLDLDRTGPDFGARALAALQSEGGPLCGLEVSFRSVHYDWADVPLLDDVLGAVNTAGSAIVASSEGGLFEYGSDQEIVTNLRSIWNNSPADAVVVGSVLRDERTCDPNLVVIKHAHRMPLRLLGLEAFERLARDAGWVVDQSIDDNPFYHDVSLRKA